MATLTLKVPQHTGEELPSKVLADLKSDLSSLSNETNRVSPMVDAEHNADGTHKEIHTPSIVLNGVQRNTWPSPGSAAVALTDVLTNGEKGNIPAAGRFELRDSTGTKTYFAVDEATGKVTQVDLDGMMGNIRDTLVEIPFKRTNDEIRLSGTQTFTRASTGTYVDPLDGLVKTAAVDTPRFERMADGGVGILLEGSSTNYLLHSQDFTQAAWIKNRVTVTGNTVTGPDGAVSADTITDDVTTGTHVIGQPGILPAGGQTTYYILSAGTISTAEVGIWNGTDGFVADAVFDLSTGTIVSNASGTAKIKDLGGGWYWCEVSGTGTVASDSYCYIYNGARSYTGTGTGTIHVWHGQAENLPFGSSIIPTTTAAVTRAADVCSVAVQGNAAINHTIIMDYDIFGFAGLIQGLFKYRGITVDAYYNSLGQLIVRNYGSAGNAWLSSTSTSANQKIRLAVTQNNGVESIYINGALAASVSGGGDPSYAGALDLDIGNFSLASPLFGHIRNFRIYDRALTDAEIAAA